MAVPIALSLHEAAKNEVTLAFGLSQKCLTWKKPERIIGDKAYDSDTLDSKLAADGIEMIAVHRKNRKKKRTQDGSKLRRQKLRWCGALLRLATQISAVACPLRTQIVTVQGVGNFQGSKHVLKSTWTIG